MDNKTIQSHFSELIIETHRLASQIKDQDLDLSMEVRIVADQLAKIGNEYHEYTLRNPE